MPLLRKRVLWILLITAALAAAIAAAVVLRKLAPPEPARLLPPADAFLYLNLKPLRRAGAFQKMPPVKVDPEYQQFVNATGFQYERDLDEAALAVHLPTKLVLGSSPPPEIRYSEVFTARFDSSRLTAYLQRISQGVEQYRNRDVYLIPLPGRTVRVTLLGPGLVAASNTDDPRVIRGIIDRSRELALPFGGPDLLRRYYKDVPIFSFAWALATITPPPSGEANRLFVMPGGFDLFVPSGTVLLGSLRYVNTLQLQLQATAANEADAGRLTDQLSALLALARQLEAASPQAESLHDVQSFLDTVHIERDGQHLKLSASVPTDLLQQLASGPPPPPPPAPVPPAQEKHTTRRHRRK